jgi:hypothetical protein
MNKFDHQLIQINVALKNTLQKLNCSDQPDTQYKWRLPWDSSESIWQKGCPDIQ